MNKKWIASAAALVMALILAVPAVANGASGDNTGEDNFGANITINNSDLYGEYELGTEKIFTTSTYSGVDKDLVLYREISITGNGRMSDLEYMNDSGEWRPIDEYNTQVTIVNDVKRQFKVTFYEEGIYLLEYRWYNSEGAETIYRYRYMQVTATEILQYTPEETSEEVTSEETTPEETSVEVTSEETTSEETSGEVTGEETTPEETSGEITSEETTPEESGSDETGTEDIETGDETTGATEETTDDSKIEDPEIEETSDDEDTSGDDLSAGDDKENLGADTNLDVFITDGEYTDTGMETGLGKVKIKKVKANLSNGKIRINLKKVKGATKYRVRISKKKKFGSKNIIFKKSYKARKLTINTKKISQINELANQHKKIYIQARAAKKENGTKTFGKWSKVKKIKL